MLMTIFSVIIALLMGFFTPPTVDFDAASLSTLMLVGGTVILLGTIFLNSLVLIPLQHLEQKLIPNLMNLLRHDQMLHFGRLFLFLFSLVSVVCVAFISLVVNPIYQHWFFLAWIIFFGLSLDILRDSWNRLVNFLNPSYVVSHISHEAMKAIQNSEDSKLLNSLDNLSEIGLRATEKSKIALSTQVLQTFPPIIHAFLSASRSISHTDTPTSPAKVGDEASFAIFYLLQRLELINDRALRDRLETVCRQMIMSMGKIIVYCAQYDLSLVSFPTHFLTKFGLKAQQHHFDEVAVLTTSTLLEVAKTIVTDIDLTYAELQEPFRAIINGLDAIAKATFKKHKNTSIKFLVQPLVDLKALFQTEKMAHHPDTPVIVQDIDRVIEEYVILEQVMQTMPSLPDLETREGPASSASPTI